MKLSPTLLTQIALTAGITATSATPLSIAGIAAAKAAGDGGCVRPAIEKKVRMPKQKSAAELFVKADINKDGKLSKEEFDIAFKAIVAQEKAKQVRKPQPIHPIGPGDGCPGCGLG